MVNYSTAERLINFAPIAILGLGILLLLALAAAGGHYARRFRKRGDEPEDDQEGHIIGATIGMLALLLAFTFAMAVDRFDQRRSMVVTEANSISAAYLMAQTFDQPHRAQIGQILIEYLDNRIATARSADLDRSAELLRLGDHLKNRLWAASLAAVADRRDDVSSSYLQSAHELIEAAAAREAGRRSRIPAPVHAALLTIAMITAGLLGFVMDGTSRQVEMGILLALVTGAMTLIVDLDRPTSGMVIESQVAMERLKARVQDVPPEAFDSPASAR